MNHVAGVIKMHYRNKLQWFFVPWIIVLASFVINAFIGILIGGKTSLYSGGVSSIYIYTFIAAIAILNETFPFALAFSVRRMDYFLGTTTMAVVVSAVTALVLLLLSLTETHLIVGWGVGLHFFHLPYVSDGSFIAQLWTYFVLMLFMYMFGFAIASVYRRLGRNGLLIFFAVLFLLSSGLALICTYLRWWVPMFGWLGQYSASELASWMLLPIAVYIIVSYLLLHKATV